MTALPLTSTPPLAAKSPPEKTVETLFLRYLLQCFPLGEASLYAPSSREEYVDGYDARVMGASAFWELFLQFKRPNLTQKGFTIRFTEHQHRRLRQYPPQTAYYIGATFRSVQEVMDAQRTITDPRAFLARFIAIDLACLEDDACFIQYESADTPRQGTPTAAAYKREQDDPPVLAGEPPPPKMRRAVHSLKQPCFMNAADLLDRFASRHAGSAVLLRRGGRIRNEATKHTVSAGSWANAVEAQVPHLNLWDDETELWPDEIDITDAARAVLSDLPQVSETQRVLILDRERADERFFEGADDQIGGGYGLRLPLTYQTLPFLGQINSGWW